MVVRYLCALVILALTASSCTNGDEECLVSKTKNVARTDYMSKIEEVAEEVEGVNDADAIVHLQMRAVVDNPHGHAGKSQESPKDLDPDRHSQTANIQNASPVLEQEPSAKEDVRKAAPMKAVQQKVVVSLMQVYTQSAPFLQIATVLGVLAIALVLRKLVNFIEQTAMKSNAKLDPFDASAKLQQLLQALRFEPPGEDETQPWTKEMQPPVQTVEQMEEEMTEHTPLEAEDEPEGEASVDHAVIALAEPDKQPATYKREQKKQGLTLALQKSGLSIAMDEQPNVKPKMAERTERVVLKAQVLSC